MADKCIESNPDIAGIGVSPRRLARFRRFCLLYLIEDFPRSASIST